MTIKEFDNKSLSMRKELMDEWKLKRPSVYTLERIAERLMAFVKELREENTEIDQKLYWLKMKLDIFLADLDGKLLHDYEKENKRYHGKWSTERAILVGYISSFKEILENRNLSE